MFFNNDVHGRWGTQCDQIPSANKMPPAFGPEEMRYQKDVRAYGPTSKWLFLGQTSHTRGKTAVLQWTSACIQTSKPPPMTQRTTGERDCDQEAGEPGDGAHGIPHPASAHLPRHRISRERVSFADISGQHPVFNISSVEQRSSTRTVLIGKCKWHRSKLLPLLMWFLNRPKTSDN